MKKKIMVTVATLSLAGLMVVPAFANEDIQSNNKFSWENNRKPAIEIIAEKVGLSVEELLEKKEDGISCSELLEEHGLSLDMIREERLEEEFKAIDEKVNSGILTEEEGEAIKEKISSYRFLQDGNGPHRGKREGMKLNLGGNTSTGNRGRGFGFRR